MPWTWNLFVISTLTFIIAYTRGASHQRPVLPHTAPLVFFRNLPHDCRPSKHFNSRHTSLETISHLFGSILVLRIRILRLLGQLVGLFVRILVTVKTNAVPWQLE